MKNIHVLPTDKPSRLCIYNSCNELNYSEIEGLSNKHITNQHMFITSDEEIKEGDWFIRDGSIHKCFRVHKTDIEFLTSIDSVYCGSNTFWSKEFCKKIMLTTDTDLIADGVQAIGDDFLEWFVQNPSCEYVEVDSKLIVTQTKPLIQHQGSKPIVVPHKINYKIIIPKEKCTCKIGQPYNNACCKVHGNIPKEEPKQETLEEAAECKSHHSEEDFIGGAKWQAEIMYSEEEVKEIILDAISSCTDGLNSHYQDFEEWFEQFKK